MFHLHKNMSGNALSKMSTPCGTFKIVLVLWMESTSQYHVHPIHDVFITISAITLLFSYQIATPTILSRPWILGRIVPKVTVEFYGMVS